MIWLSLDHQMQHQHIQSKYDLVMTIKITKYDFLMQNLEITKSIYIEWMFLYGDNGLQLGFTIVLRGYFNFHLEKQVYTTRSMAVFIAKAQIRIVILKCQ